MAGSRSLWAAVLAIMCAAWPCIAQSEETPAETSAPDPTPRAKIIDVTVEPGEDASEGEAPVRTAPDELIRAPGPLGSIFLERQASYTDTQYFPASNTDSSGEPGLLDVSPADPSATGALGSIFLERQAQFIPEGGGLPGERPGGGAMPGPSGFRFGDGIGNYGAPESGGLPGYRRPGPGSGFGTVELPPMPEERANRPRPYEPNMEPRSRKLAAEFGSGLEFRTDDGYFTLVFHNLTQLDYRVFNPQGNPLHDSFIVPRQRWYFVGNVSEYVRYYTVINRGYGSLDVLDAFGDLNFGYIEREKFQIRIGRMKTPYTYEYIKIAETDLIAPERSVFVGNFAPNRQEGAMIHGDLVERRMEYAVGVFNGPRRSFQSFQSNPNLFTFVNLKPFLKGDWDVLKQVNLSGSFNYGRENNPLQPAVLSTANDQTTSATAQNVSPTFLEFNSTVFENGPRAQWAGDLAYYYKSFGMLAGYQGGYANYGISPTAIPSNFIGVTSPTRTRVPLSGYSIAAFYFITGEEITRRVELLEPRRSWGRGPGAIELFGRFANLELGNNVFTSGLVNPVLWSNRANVTDLGVNWYLHHYIKLTFDWQYSDFGKPVTLGQGKFTRFENLFWTRMQIYF